MEDSVKKLAVAALIIISILLLYFLYYASAVSVILRGVAAIALLLLDGLIIQTLLKLNGGYGFYMFGSHSGLATISNISKKYGVFWDVMAMWALPSDSEC